MSRPSRQFKAVDALIVTAQGSRVGELIRVEGKGIYFTYDKAWLANGFNLSPIAMKFDEKPQLAEPEPFRGLHGPFADSLPDGWGLKLMDRFFDASFGAGTSRTLTPLDRLAYMGNRAMGFLEYHPETEHATAESVDLAQLFEASIDVQKGETPCVLRELRIAGGSPGGARPKAVVALSQDHRSATSAFEALPAGHEHWLAKFRSLDEPRETGAIEQAYATMAREAGVTMAHTALLDVALREAEYERVFASKRFDREGDRKVHMMTASALTHADYRLPSLDYSDLVKLTHHLTRSAAEVEKMARLMIFNAVFHNQDDHGKNFAFLYGKDSGAKALPAWTLAPAYDLTFSNGMGEHATSFAGLGKADRKTLRTLCRDYKYLKPDQYLDQTLAALDTWPKVIEGLKLEASADLGIFNVLEKARGRF